MFDVVCQSAHSPHPLLLRGTHPGGLLGTAHHLRPDPTANDGTTQREPHPLPLSHHYAGDTHLPRGEHHSNRPVSTVDELHRQQTALGTDVRHRGTSEHPRTRPDTR